MKITAAATFFSLASAAVMPVPRQNDEKYVSVSVVDEATYHHPEVYANLGTSALGSSGPRVTVTVTTTVTAAAGTTTDKYPTTPTVCATFRA